jgi:hypothetical protein
VIKMGLIDRLHAGYREGQEAAREEEIRIRHAKERTRRQELKSGQQNPSKLGRALGKAEVKTRGARKSLTAAGKKVGASTKKNAPKLVSGAKKAHGILADYYGPPPKQAPKKRKKSTTTPRKKRKKRASSSGDDDFFSSRGLF